MAVIPDSVCLHWNGSTGSAEVSGPSYVAVWRLKVDDPLDQSKTVLEWWQINMFPLYAPYVYGNDTASIMALALNISANRVSNSLDSWEVTVNYGVPDPSDQEQRDDDGNRVEDPTLWRKRFAFGTTQGRRPVQWANYIIGYGPGFESRYPMLSAGGEARIQPCNSAFTPFVNPPVEEDVSKAWLMVGGNFPATVDVKKATDVENFVNTDQFKIAHRGMTWQGLQSGRDLKIRQVKVEARTANNIDYVAIDYYMDIAPKIPRRGSAVHEIWDSLTLDQGVYARAVSGDPDGEGDTLSGQDLVPAGRPKLRLPVDANDRPINEIVNFDGDGQPINYETTPAPDEVYGQWRHYNETAFLGVDYLKTLLAAPDPP